MEPITQAEQIAIDPIIQIISVVSGPWQLFGFLLAGIIFIKPFREWLTKAFRDKKHVEDTDKLVRSVSLLGDGHVEMRRDILQLKLMRLFKEHPNDEEHIQETYNIYKTLGGNSFIDSMFNDWMRDHEVHQRRYRERMGCQALFDKKQDKIKQ